MTGRVLPIGWAAAGLLAMLVLALVFFLIATSRRMLAKPKSPASVLESQEHRLRKYYSVGEAASILGISEEALYQQAITGEVALSIIEHSPQNYETTVEKTVDGEVVSQTKTWTTIHVGKEQPLLNLWYIKPRDATNIIRNPVDSKTLINSLYPTRSCDAGGKWLVNSHLKCTKADLFVSSDELRRFVDASRGRR